MAAVQVGLKSTGKDLKAMLEKTGYNVRKLEGAEKLDILELVRGQIEYCIEARRRTRLLFHELIAFLELEGMVPGDCRARGAIVKLRELQDRERARLGKHVSHSEFEAFEDALALIPDSEIYDAFQLESSAKKRRLDASPRDVPRLEDAQQAVDVLLSSRAADSSADSQLMLEDAAREERILARLDRDALREHLPVLGSPPEGPGDDLTRIRGIGPWIQKRLNSVQICSFQQIARMTDAVRLDLAKAIRFFPGRIERDLWVFQAQRLASGKEWIIHPPIEKSAPSPTVDIQSEVYQRKLVDIAQHYGSGGAELGIEHAECLWFAAMDGQTITNLERKTLQYILQEFKVSPRAKELLTNDLDCVPNKEA